MPKQEDARTLKVLAECCAFGKWRLVGRHGPATNQQPVGNVSSWWSEWFLKQCQFGPDDNQLGL